MSCYHPMIYINPDDMTDPKQRQILDTLSMLHKGEKTKKYVHGMLIPRELAVSEGLDLQKNKALLIPCGQCIGCRLDYSREWAERCVHEAEQYSDNYFLTLTYDDAHLPYGKKGFASLVKDEVSSFMKRLREAFKRKFGHDGIRFFACGEYGDHTLRPHYHIILFNCPIPDLQERHPIMVDGKLKWIRQFDSDGSALLFSPTIYDCWQKKGTCEIGQVSYESCAYVARYVVKKLKGKDAQSYKDQDVEPPFVRMSRMPGIGYDWYMSNLNHIYDTDTVVFKRGEDVIVKKPGKYCDKLLQKEHPQMFYDLKWKRHQDFYDAVAVKGYESVDLAINNHKAESEKENQTKILKRVL